MSRLPGFCGKIAFWGKAVGIMRSSSLGWAVVILALTLTTWNVMEYQRDLWSAPSVFLSDEFMQGRRSRLLPKYLEREVLIVGGVAVAAWLVATRRKIT
jgi:hypothetical protein